MRAQLRKTAPQLKGVSLRLPVLTAPTVDSTPQEWQSFMEELYRFALCMGKTAEEKHSLHLPTPTRPCKDSVSVDQVGKFGNSMAIYDVRVARFHQNLANCFDVDSQTTRVKLPVASWDVV